MTKRNALFWYSLLIADIGLLFVLLAIIDWGNLFFFLNPDYISNPDLYTTSDGYNFALGFGGAVMLGWGITLYAISQEYTRSLGKFVLYGAAVWYVTDSITSLTSGFYLNIISNTGFLIITYFVIKMMNKEVDEK